MRGPKGTQNLAWGHFSNFKPTTMRNQLFVSMRINPNRTNRNGMCNIRCRVSLNKQRREFSTGQHVFPDQWDSVKQKVPDKYDRADTINTELSLIQTKLRQAFLLSKIEGESDHIDSVLNIYYGKKDQKEYGFDEYSSLFLDNLKKHVTIDIKYLTFRKYELVIEHFVEYLHLEMGQKNIPLNNLNIKCLQSFELFLKASKGHKQVSANKVIQRLKKVIRTAVGEGYLDKDPFLLYKPKPVTKTVVFLTTSELEKLENYKFSQMRLQTVKDLFILCCYTGLGYAEMSSLKRSHIQVGFDKLQWIVIERKKTGRLLQIPLLPKAIELLKSYLPTDGQLPTISNQKFNSYLKEIAAIVGIEKRLTHHTARKTFASTVLLYNDVPIEIVSTLLGHSNIKITNDYYGKVVQKRVSEEIKRLGNKK